LGFRRQGYIPPILQGENPNIASFHRQACAPETTFDASFCEESEAEHGDQ
jgi:hypothetical protein